MSKIILNNVRLSFPSIFKTESYNGVDTGKYAATFLISKEEELGDKLKVAIKKIITDNKAKVSKDKICLKDGDELEYAGYDGHWSIKATSRNKIALINRDKSKVSEEDGVFYSGCYVNAMIELWFQNNNYGKRINASLLGVQFVKDGEPLGGSVINVDAISEQFESLSVSESVAEEADFI